MNESTDGLLARFPVIPTKVGIHDFRCCTQESRGWLAFARHDVLVRVLRNSTQLLLRVA
jgi:hypothetical protein